MPVGGKVVAVCRTGRASRSRSLQRMVSRREFTRRLQVFPVAVLAETRARRAAGLGLPAQ